MNFKLFWKIFYVSFSTSCQYRRIKRVIDSAIFCKFLCFVWLHLNLGYSCFSQEYILWTRRFLHSYQLALSHYDRNIKIGKVLKSINIRDVPLEWNEQHIYLFINWNVYYIKCFYKYNTCFKYNYKICNLFMIFLMNKKYAC